MKIYDVIDMQPIAGEYVGCRETSEFEELGHKVVAFHRYHAKRCVISNHWDSKCERCNHHIRWAVVMVDADGKYHVFGHDCAMNVEHGTEDANKFRITQAIKEIETKKGRRYIWGCNVPPALWDIPKEQRPKFLSLSKLPSMKHGGRPTWRLTVWGENPSETLANVLALRELVTVPL